MKYIHFTIFFTLGAAFTLYSNEPVGKQQAPKPIVDLIEEIPFDELSSEELQHIVELLLKKISSDKLSPEGTRLVANLLLTKIPFEKLPSEQARHIIERLLAKVSFDNLSSERTHHATSLLLTKIPFEKLRPEDARHITELLLEKIPFENMTAEQADQVTILLLEKTPLDEEARYATEQQTQKIKQSSEAWANQLIDTFLQYIDKQEEEYKARKPSPPIENTIITKFLPVFAALSLFGPKKISVIATLASVFVLYKKRQIDVAHKQMTDYERLSDYHDMLKRLLLYSIEETTERVAQIKNQEIDKENLLDDPFIQLLQKLNDNALENARLFVESQGWIAGESPFKNKPQKEVNDGIKEKSAALISDLIKDHFNTVQFLQQQYRSEPEEKAAVKSKSSQNK